MGLVFRVWLTAIAFILRLKKEREGGHSQGRRRHALCVDDDL